MKKNSLIQILCVMLCGAFIAILAVSFTMHTLSSTLEKDNEPKVVENALDYDSSSVIQIIGTGIVDSTNSNASISEDFAETIANYNVSVFHQKNTSTKEAQDVADIFVEAGFTTVGLANDESNSTGKDGVVSALKYWNTRNILTQGINSSTDKQNINRSFEENGISIIYLSFTDVLDNEMGEQEKYLVNVYDDEKTPEIVEEARKNADVVIVSMYWNGENGAYPSDRQIEVATKLADAGASIIFGNADDAIQPVDWIDDTLVFYSMGNALTDEDDYALGLVGAVTITKHTVYDKVQIELTNPKVDCIYEKKEDDNVEVAFYDNSTNLATKYADLISILHMMDDSIRIGGIQ
jgi:poly-gamma-glutamate capsule biosynthesis protein CapA/YwtB (metallophosphatase superfamily)